MHCWQPVAAGRTSAVTMSNVHVAPAHRCMMRGGAVPAAGADVSEAAAQVAGGWVAAAAGRDWCWPDLLGTLSVLTAAVQVSSAVGWRGAADSAAGVVAAAGSAGAADSAAGVVAAAG